ncbi:MAG: DUF167 domain-containing protein [Candidatus Micrarchaeota archaeon]|nr:DUF167 domain-containing protein [Candidatus Micrarchaeota archaeon]
MTRISVAVIPNSKSALISKIGDTEYRVKVDAKAVGGKANERLVEILADHFSVRKSSVRIVKGALGRNKTVEISGALVPPSVP